MTSHTGSQWQRKYYNLRLWFPGPGMLFSILDSPITAYSSSWPGPHPRLTLSWHPPLDHSVLATWASLLFLRYTKQSPTSGPLHFPPGCQALFPQGHMDQFFTVSRSLSRRHLLRRPSLIIVSKIELPVTFYLLCLIHLSSQHLPVSW